MSDIRIETAEDGFYLEVNGITTCRIDDPEALYDHVKAAIGPWLYERDQARATLNDRNPDSVVGVAWNEDGFAATGFESPPDGLSAYGFDPKAREWHSVHADHYDNREPDIPIRHRPQDDLTEEGRAQVEKKLERLIRDDDR